MQKTQNEDTQIKTQHSKLKRWDPLKVQITQIREEHLYEQIREKYIEVRINTLNNTITYILYFILLILTA
jgi:hypothetical protein